MAPSAFISSVHHRRRTLTDVVRVTRAYSGYIDIGARHLYFTFVESLNDPTNDPVVIWISGGPLVSCPTFFHRIITHVRALL